MRATWFLTTAASVSTLICPPATRAFVQMKSAAFAPIVSPFSCFQQRPSPSIREEGRVRYFNLRSGTRALSVTRAEAIDTNQPDAVEDEVDPGVIEGTDLRVLKYPHPSLRAVDEEVTEFDDDLKRTLKEMFLVMYASKGVGLAAPQVGINKRIMVFNPEGDKRKWLQEVSLVNPKIVETSETTDVEEGKVRRFKWIKVEAQDANGKAIKKKYAGWTARVFQHEYDHLEGTVYVDRLEEQDDKDLVKPKLEELANKYKEETGQEGAPQLKF